MLCSLALCGPRPPLQATSNLSPCFRPIHRKCPKQPLLVFRHSLDIPGLSPFPRMCPKELALVLGPLPNHARATLPTKTLCIVPRILVDVGIYIGVVLNAHF